MNGLKTYYSKGKDANGKALVILTGASVLFVSERERKRERES